MSHVGCANRLGKKEKKKKEKNGRNMVLMRNGKLIPVCGNGFRFIRFVNVMVSEGGIVQKRKRTVSDMFMSFVLGVQIGQ